MCAPALGAVVGMLSSVASFAAAQSDYEAKAEAWRQNYVYSLAAGRDEHTQLMIRKMQEAKKNQQAQHLVNVEVAKKRADAVVSASSQGVSGNSVGELLTDITRQGAYNNEINAENYKMVALQLQEEDKAVVNREKSRINSMERPVAPNPLTMVVGILKAGVGMFGEGGGSGMSFQAA